MTAIKRAIWITLLHIQVIEKLLPEQKLDGSECQQIRQLLRAIEFKIDNQDKVKK